MKKLLLLFTFIFILSSCDDSGTYYSGKLEKWRVSRIEPRLDGNTLVYLQTDTETSWFISYYGDGSDFRKGDTITVLVKTVIPKPK